MELEITELPVAELIAKPSGGGRQLTPRDVALDALVLKANQPENAETALGWKYSPEKLVTARAAAQRAIKRNGLVDKVFVATKSDMLWFSQQRISNRGRKPAK